MHLQGRLFAGMVLIIPIAVTVLIFTVVVNLLDDFLRPLSDQVGGRLPDWMPDRVWIPVLSIILTLGILYLVGLAAQNFIGRRLIFWGNTVIGRVPIVRGIYRAAAQATDMFAGTDSKRFSRVVLVEFPRTGIKSLGFVTGQYRGLAGEEYTIVYIPTVPNPTSGFMAFVKEDQVVDAGMTKDAAMKVVLSGGILTQELQRAKTPKG